MNTSAATVGTVIDPDDLLRRIDRLIIALEKPKSVDETIWTVDQIAAWLDLAKRTVEMRVITRTDFPASFRPVDSTQAQRRWFAADVIEWARLTRGTLPTRRGRPRKA